MSPKVIRVNVTIEKQLWDEFVTLRRHSLKDYGVKLSFSPLCNKALTQFLDMAKFVQQKASRPSRQPNREAALREALAYTLNKRKGLVGEEKLKEPMPPVTEVTVPKDVVKVREKTKKRVKTRKPA